MYIVITAFKGLEKTKNVTSWNLMIHHNWFDGLIGLNRIQEIQHELLTYDLWNLKPRSK